MILVIAWFQAYVQSKPRASGDDPPGSGLVLLLGA